jgi:GWxTD domain-containing protein
MKATRLIVMVLIAVGLFQCAPLNKMTYSNMAFTYDRENNAPDLRAVAYHVSTDRTEIRYAFSLSALLYQKSSVNSRFTADFSIRYELFDSFDSRMLIDSATFFFSDSLNHGYDETFTSSFLVKTIYPGNFLMNMTMTDLNRKKGVDIVLELYKDSGFSRQNFLVTGESGSALYNNWVGRDEIIRIRCNKQDQPFLFVSYFRNEFPIAAPPFMEGERNNFEYRPDSLYKVELLGGETGLILLENEGLYHFQADTSTRSGCTLFRFGEGFPSVVNPVQMLSPLRYLTTKKEYGKMESEPEIKEAVEDFWIHHAGNEDRAKIQIRKFYNRVQDANRFFSSYLEGWKTDRGMVYIVFGPPNIVYRRTQMEQWIYGEEGNMMSITFNYSKVINPFTENDYMLYRSPALKEDWYMAVDGWRR